ncbi:MAG: hypothetical protein ABW061_09165, partial [Polyangiaceae bacterium]
KCDAVCHSKVPSTETNGDPAECKQDCTATLCDTAGWTAACVKALDDLLDCVPTADPALYYCSGYDGTEAHNLDGTFQFDLSADDKCPAVYAAYTACL